MRILKTAILRSFVWFIFWVSAVCDWINPSRIRKAILQGAEPAFNVGSFHKNRIYKEILDEHLKWRGHGLNAAIHLLMLVRLDPLGNAKRVDEYLTHYLPRWTPAWRVLRYQLKRMYTCYQERAKDHHPYEEKCAEVVRRLKDL